MSEATWYKMLAVSFALHILVVTSFSITFNSTKKRIDLSSSYSVNLVGGVGDAGDGQKMASAAKTIPGRPAPTVKETRPAPAKNKPIPIKKEDLVSLSKKKIPEKSGTTEEEREQLQKKIQNLRRNTEYLDVAKSARSGSATSGGLMGTGGLSGSGEGGGMADPLMQKYYMDVMEKIDAVWRIPASAKKNLLSVVVIKIRRDGVVVDITPETMSGNRLYDESIMRAIRAAEPLPRIPTAIKEDTVEIGFNFRPGEDVVTVFQSIIMGAIQGITEFLPVSSSAHLIIIPWFFNIQDGNINKITYDVMLHLGTLAAILCVYGKRFIRVVMEGLVDFKEGRGKGSLLAKLIVATIPAVVAGFFGQHIVETYLRTPFVAAYMLAFVSILMIIAERIHVERSDVSYPVATAIGIAQAVALVPGTSRSGATITMGMLLGLKRSDAVDFSFMLSVPIIFGTALYEMRQFQYHSGNMSIYVYGALSAFIFGALSLGVLIRYLKKHPLDVFAYYRIVLALIILFAAL